MNICHCALTTGYMPMTSVLIYQLESGFEPVTSESQRHFHLQRWSACWKFYTDPSVKIELALAGWYHTPATAASRPQPEYWPLSSLYLTVVYSHYLNGGDMRTCHYRLESTSKRMYITMNISTAMSWLYVNQTIHLKQNLSALSYLVRIPSKL